MPEQAETAAMRMKRLRAAREACKALGLPVELLPKLEPVSETHGANDSDKFTAATRAFS